MGPRKLEPHNRKTDWLEKHLHKRLTFSSFSISMDDIWGQHIPRPYQICLLPGYTIPDSLDRGNKDSLAHRKGEVSKSPEIVWDGFCPTALHEIILECFDPGGTSPFIKVIDAQTGEEIPDPRPERALKIRPVRPKGLGPRGIYNHIVELRYWAFLLPPNDPTAEIYHEILRPNHRRVDNTLDSMHRRAKFYSCDMDREDVRAFWERKIEAGDYKSTPLVHGALPGEDPERSRRDSEVRLRDLRYCTISDFEDLTYGDLPNPDKPPASYYELAQQVALRRLGEARADVATFATRKAQAVTDRNPNGDILDGEYPIED